MRLKMEISEIEWELVDRNEDEIKRLEEQLLKSYRRMKDGIETTDISATDLRQGYSV